MFRIPSAPSNIRINRVTCVEAVAESPKMIGKNAVRDDHGATTKERLVRLYTDKGHHGFGVTRASAGQVEQEAAQILGQHPLSLLDPKEGLALKGVEHALWDLIGQIADKPVHALIGEKCRAEVEAYDGGLYFCDLVYPDENLHRVAKETEESLAAGHRAIKMKIGRGHKWMPAEKGFQRDVDAIRLVRQIIGPDVLLMVDGNNGFDCAGAEKLFEAIGDQDIFWAEELFPETVEDYTRFREFLTRNGLKTLIADGETLAEPSPLYPFIEQRLIDVCQLDLNQIGLSAWLKLAAFCNDYGVLCAPHTWASRFALYASLHLGKVLPNFLSAEVPAYVPDIYQPVGFEFHYGAYVVLPVPGWGLKLDGKAYRKRYGNQEQVWE